MVGVQLIPSQHPRGFAQRWFWSYPTLVVGSSFSHDSQWAWVLCLGAGVAWQLVFRRDLADRLTVVCIYVAVAVGLALPVEAASGPGFRSEFGPGGAMAILSCLSGLVLTEQVLRNRDLMRARRAARASAPPVEETVPARP